MHSGQIYILVDILQSQKSILLIQYFPYLCDIEQW